MGRPDRSGASSGTGLRTRLAVERLPLGMRRFGILACDLGVAALSLPVALWLRYGDWDHALTALPAGAPWLFLAVFLAAYRLFGLHRGIWRYTTLADLLVILEVATASVVAFALLAFLLHRLEGVPRSLPILQWGVLVLGLAGPRVLYRALREGEFGGVVREILRGRPVRPVLLVGIDTHTPYLVRWLREGEDPRTVVGLLSVDGRERQGQHLAGVPVLGGLDDLEAVVASLERRGLRPIQVILGTRLPPARLEDLLERCRALDLELLRSPDPRELEDAAHAPRLRLRPLVLEDLLERPEICLDDTVVRRLVAGRRVLVTGGGGSIGGELVRQILRHGPAEVVILDHAEPALFDMERELARPGAPMPVRTVLADVRDRRRIADLFAALRPQLVFHAAALKHVPIVERNPREGILTNVIGTRNVADAAVACGALGMVLISTDKAVNPTSVMGATKRLAEFYCQMRDLESRRLGRGPRFVTVRFGNVLGSSGSVLTVFRRQLERGEALTVTHPEITRYFMTVSEAVQLVLHASAFGIEGGADAGHIFVLDMGEPVRILDLARKLIRLAGLDEQRTPIEIIGLRPGEKLYEELFDEGEERAPAPINGLHLARPCPLDRMRLERAFNVLEAAVRDGMSDEQLMRLLALFVPGYRPAVEGDEPGTSRDGGPSRRLPGG